MTRQSHPDSARRLLLGGLAAVLPLALLAACSRGKAAQSRENAGSLDADERDVRKRRNELRLKAEGVPTIDHLPGIETAAEAELRSVRESADRLLALTIVAFKAERLLSGDRPETVRDTVAGAVREHKAQSLFTPKENAFIRTLRPAADDSTQLIWRYEAAWVLAWALQWIDGPLSPPRQQCDYSRLSAIVHETPDLAARGLRPIGEILDAADLIYRYHWASSEALLKGGTPPTGLVEDVIVERHQALNWLIGYQGQAWDDVTTDT